MNKLIKIPKGNWGILGGAFDPIHLGHLNLAQEIHIKRKLNGVLFVPSYISPLKENEIVVTYEQRCDMIDLMISNLENLFISTIEQDLPKPSYTLNTIRYLKKKNPEANFYFITGSDVFDTIDKWYKPKELLDEVHFLVGARPGTYDESNLKKYSTNYSRIDIEMKDISSTAIEEKVKKGISHSELSNYVGEHVASYILKERLYH